MDFNPVDFSLFVFPPERMGSICMKVSVTVRSASITEIDHVLVTAFPVMRDKVPEIVWVLDAWSWVFLSWVSQVWELYRVFDPEDRSWVANKVPVAFLSVELDTQTLILLELPLGSLSVSPEPCSPIVVENLAKIGVCFPTASKSLALQYLVTSLVTTKTPCAPVPLAWATLSGMRSLSNLANLSIRWWSWIKTGPY